MARKTQTTGREILHDGVIDYYVSVNNPVSYLMLDSLLGNQFGWVKISQLKNYSEDDLSQNIIISVSETNKECRNFILYLIRKKYLAVPTLNGVPVNRIATQLFLNNELPQQTTKTGAYLLKNDFAFCDSPIVSEIEAAGQLAALEKYIWSFPHQVLKPIDVFRYYDAAPYRNDVNWEYASAHEAELKAIYDGYLLTMRENGLVPTKWINEFDLFLLIRELFPDALYQHRCEWLGQQSYDIYIPSKNIAIEYQGKQHYEPIEFFGGGDGFSGTIARDQRKRLLSQEHGVRVLDWKYTVKVNFKNVLTFLREHSVAYELPDVQPLADSSLLCGSHKESILPKSESAKTKKASEKESAFVIRQYSPDGKFLLEFLSVADAAESVELSSMAESQRD